MPVGNFAPAILFFATALISHQTRGDQPITKNSNTSRTKKDAVQVVTALSTPLASGHPVLFLTGANDSKDEASSRIQFPPDQRYSKWSVLFDAPLRIESVEVETCKDTKNFSDGVELFLDFNNKRFFSDGGRRTARFNIKQSAQALTLGFLESPGLCLERVKLVTNAEWLKPRTLLAEGNSVLADGRLHAGVRTLGDGSMTKFPKANVKTSRSQGEWRLTWENPLIVERLKIWNGNQGPGETFFENDRVREIEIRTDSDKPFRTTLKDHRFQQEIELPEPHAIRSLELKSRSTYSGNRNGEPLLSEIQFSAGGENWIPISIVKPGDSDSGESLQAEFARERGYGDVLDRELRVDDRGEMWRFRIRSDGTFYARVFVDRARVARAWSVMGSWRVVDRPAPPKEPESQATGFSKSLLRSLSGVSSGKSASPEKPYNIESPGLGLTFVGMKIATSDVADSLPCANHCFPELEGRRASDVRELPVFEQLELQRAGRSTFFLRNRTDLNKRTLDFSDLKVRIHSLYE